MDVQPLREGQEGRKEEIDLSRLDLFDLPGPETGGAGELPDAETFLSTQGGQSTAKLEQCFFFSVHAVEYLPVDNDNKYQCMDGTEGERITERPGN
jgi:hypothetical protein